MEVTGIPFNKKIGIRDSDDGNVLSLQQSSELHNHLGTVHASAQFALAEAASGAYLLRKFPELSTQVVSVVRKAAVTFKKPATSDLTATANIDAEEEEKFVQLLHQKGRAIIAVTVTISDQQGKTTAIAIYDWFIQKI